MTAKATKVEYFRADLSAALQRQYETARHHQDIRDRWQRFYSVAVGAVVSLAGALITALMSEHTKLPPNVDVYRDVVPWVVIVTMCLLFAFGCLFLALYLAQIIGYYLNYYQIAQMTQCYAKIHSDAVQELGIKNPFLFSYAYLTDMAKEGRGSFVKQYCLDLRSYGADFWANSVTIFMNGICGTVAFAVWFWPVECRCEYLMWLFVLVSLGLGQAVIRQVLLASALYSAFHTVGDNAST